MVSMHSAQAAERFPAVIGNIQGQTHGVDCILIIGINAHLAEYPAIGCRVAHHIALRLRCLTTHFCPALTFVIRTVDRCPFYDTA